MKFEAISKRNNAHPYKESVLGANFFGKDMQSVCPSDALAHMCALRAADPEAAIQCMYK